MNLFSRIKQMELLERSIPADPQSFTEKVRYRMAYDRRPILAEFADKFHVRNYVCNKVGKEYLSHIYDYSDSPMQIKWDKLPVNFVCKTNHGSGGMVGVWTGVEEEALLPIDHSDLGWSRWWVHPTNFDKNICASMMKHWLRENYAYRTNAFPEWAYKSINRKVYIEELLVHSNGIIASPYYFYTFNGKVEVVLISARDEKSTRFTGFVDREWNQLNLGIGEIDPQQIMNPFPEKPTNFEEMINVAETLADHIDFARVDLYPVDQKIVFSEITNYPWGGLVPWVPSEFELHMGQVWRQDVKKGFGLG